METIKDYTLSDLSDERLEAVVEKFYTNRESLIGILINWEVITTDYFKVELPDNELERKYWVGFRPSWIKKINQLFIKCKYPIQLFVSYNKGCYLYSNNHAVNSIISKQIKKSTNSLKHSADLFNELKPCFPEAGKILNAASKMMLETQYGILGKIESSKLPGNTKSALKAIVQKCLPEEEE